MLSSEEGRHFVANLPPEPPYTNPEVSNGVNTDTSGSEFATTEALVVVCSPLTSGSTVYATDDYQRVSVFGDDSLPYERSESSGSKDSPPSSSSSTNGKLVLSAPANSPGGDYLSVSALLQDDGGGKLGNKCGKCQNHDIEISKKGHARDCPFKKCNCLKCRLLDARSDILQVISGKETKLKGTKKDPNCGFCQNHGVKILRKGHVRSCGFGQERHFKLDNCFDCEVHYIRNEVNRLQIKMRRAMKEDRTLSEEQRKTTREPITRDEVEKVCDMARLARKKRENILTQQAGESSSPATMQVSASSLHSAASPSGSAMPIVTKAEHVTIASKHRHHPYHNHHHHNHQQLNQLAGQTGVWRPWSQHQVAAAMAAQQHHQQLQLVNPNININNNNHQYYQQSHNPSALPMAPPPQQNRRLAQTTTMLGAGNQVGVAIKHLPNNNNIAPSNDQQLLTSAITSMAAAANQTHLINSLQASIQQQQRRATLNQRIQRDAEPIAQQHSEHNHQINSQSFNQLSPPSTPPPPTTSVDNQPLQLTQRSAQEQQLFNTLFRLIVAQFANGAQASANQSGGGGGS